MKKKMTLLLPELLLNYHSMRWSVCEQIMLLIQPTPPLAPEFCIYALVEGSVCIVLLHGSVLGHFKVLL